MTNKQNGAQYAIQENHKIPIPLKLLQTQDNYSGEQQSTNPTQPTPKVWVMHIGTRKSITKGKGLLENFKLGTKVEY